MSEKEVDEVWPVLEREGYTFSQLMFLTGRFDVIENAKLTVLWATRNSGGWRDQAGSVQRKP